MATLLAITVGMVGFNVPSASAAPGGPLIQPNVGGLFGMGAPAILYVTQIGHEPAPGSTIKFSVWNCGKLVGSVTSTFPVQYEPSVNLNWVRNPSRYFTYEWNMSLTEPDFMGDTELSDSGTYDFGSKFGYEGHGCGGGGQSPGSGTGDTDLVKKWSTKIAHASQGRRAIVGSRVEVTRTRAISGSKVTYRWRVGTKVVKKGAGRALKVKRAYQGKVIRVRIIVEKDAVKKAKTLNFGRARR